MAATWSMWVTEGELGWNRWMVGEGEGGLHTDSMVTE